MTRIRVAGIINIAALFLAGAASFFITSHVLATLGGRGEPAVSAAPSDSPPEGFQAALEAIREAAARDAALPRFTGEIGGFVVYLDSQDRHASYPCPLARVSDRLLPSELNMEGTYEQGVCADGTVISVFGPLGARRYFVGEPHVLVDAPRERLELADLDGHAALVVRPELDFRPWLLYVIQREPTASRPGIVIQVVTERGGLAGAIDNVRRILEQH